MGITYLLTAEKEKKVVEEWRHGDSECSMTRDELLDFVIKGFSHCENDCQSRNVCGEDSCFCVRSCFPSPEHYEAYEELRRFYLECFFYTQISQLMD